MKELFEAAFSGVNIVPTILVILVLFYWLMVIIGAMDVDTVDFDFDIDTDVDLDIDADVEVDVDADIDGADSAGEGIGSVAFLNSILVFFNLGRIPFMVWLSFLVIPMWVISILFNHLIGNSSLLLALFALIPNLILSLMVSKVLTTPIAAAFAKLKINSDDQFRYTGKVCTVLMRATHHKFGQAEISRNGNIYRVNILTDKEVALEKGQTALIIEYLPEKKCYLVEPYKI